VIALVLLGAIVKGLVRVLEFSEPVSPAVRQGQVKSRLVGADGEALYLSETPPLSASLAEGQPPRAE
jgi:hypothetical protein